LCINTWTDFEFTKSGTLRSRLITASQSVICANLKDEDKVCIEETEEWRLAPGEMLVKEGKPAENFFFLLEGEIIVSKRHGDPIHRAIARAAD
jgi:CRP-like cAMP-binding protein